MADDLNNKSLLELMTRAASMYYLENMTQEAIARKLGLSRPKVGRLLKKALDQGVVEIRVRLPFLNTDLEDRIKEKFPLKEAIIVPHIDPHDQRGAVAQAAAGYLERHLSDGLVVAVGMGRNVGEIPNFFTPPRRINCTFVSAMGGSPQLETPTNPADVCHRLAGRAGGLAESLYAPAYVESRHVRDVLLKQSAVRQTLDRAIQADMAIVGIGAPDDECTLVRMGCLSLDEVRELRAVGAVGDILGYYFDKAGHPVASELHHRLIGLTSEDLRRIPTTVAVVSERNKSWAILGALRTGVLDVLVTNAGCAGAVLELAEEEAPR